MRGFGVTAVDFAIECQMDKLAHLIGMDPMEFRILNAYRDGDMKAHRREAKNCALIECVQVAAEKARWPIREEFRRASSKGRHPLPAAPAAPTRPYVPQPAAMPPLPVSPPPAPPPPQAPRPQYAASRFSSVLGTRRR
jgi:hypothetical protein